MRDIEIVPSTLTVEEVDGFCFVCCADDAGRQYIHFMRFSENDTWKARVLKLRVGEIGRIDGAHWDCYVPYGTEAWLIDDMEVTMMDDEERYYRGM